MKENDELSPFLSDERPNKAIEHLYDTYREQFLAFAHKHFPDVEYAAVIDIYQDSFIILHQNIQTKKLTAENLNVSLRTYLFSIGKNLLCNYVRDRKETVTPTENIAIEDPVTGIGSEQQEIVNRYVARLDEPCNQMLTLFYFEQKSLREIAQLMGYKSEQVAKNKRLSCVEKLKKMIKGLYNKEDFFDHE